MVDDSASLDAVQTEVADIIKEGKETIEASLSELGSSIAQHEMRIAAETERQAKWKAENERRRHNYVPLIFELLQQLAKKNILETMFKEAVELKKKKADEKKAAKAK